TASPPKADMPGSPRDVAEGPKPDSLSLALHQWFGDFVGVLDEELGNRRQRAVFQSDDPNWHADHGQLNRQDLQLWVQGTKFQCGRCCNCKKTPGRQKSYP